MRGSRALLLALILAGCAPEDRNAPLAATNPCEVRETGSRWAPRGATYQRTAEFGRRPGEALADVWGVAASPRGDVYVFDAGNTNVVRLDSGLRMVSRFGREGRGPGEFAYQRMPHGNWVAANDTSVFVLGLGVLYEFDQDGAFEGSPTRVPPFPVPIRTLATRDGRVLFATDDFDRHVNRQSGARTLSTWMLEPSGSHILLRRDPMPPLPRWHGRFVRGGLADQAEPLWALHRRCAYISDGAGDWILRADLTDDRADTVRLPHRDIPDRTPEDERRLEETRRAAARLDMRAGMAMSFRDVHPTARMKWSGLIADPDGYLWLEPWRPHSLRPQPVTAWIVNPATGAVDSVTVPAFPTAFLPDGAFVALAYDTATGVRFVEKYALTK